MNKRPAERRLKRPLIVALLPLAGLLFVETSCRVRTPVITPVVAIPINTGPRSAPPPPPQPIATGEPQMQGGPIEAGCSFNANQLRGEIGSIFQVSCPPNCQDVGGLWGTDTYTSDSGICRAAIHAGAITAAGGIVAVRVDPGRPAYRGSVHYGVRSGDYGSYRRSMTILFAEGQQRVPEAAAPVASQIVEAGCSFDANQIRAEIGTASTVSCPAGCANQGGLWGTDVYTGDSAICNAAIHAGLISPAGGTVVVILDPGRPAYRGSVRNGIRSRDYGNYRRSYHLQRP